MPFLHIYIQRAQSSLRLRKMGFFFLPLSLFPSLAVIARFRSVKHFRPITPSVRARGSCSSGLTESALKGWRGREGEAISSSDMSWALMYVEEEWMEKRGGGGTRLHFTPLSARTNGANLMTSIEHSPDLFLSVRKALKVRTTLVPLFTIRTICTM